MMLGIGKKPNIGKPVSLSPMTTQDNLLQYQIRVQAARLFHAQGFEQVRMADIAATVGVHETDLYLHFGSKQDIVLQIFQSINSEWQVAVESIAATRLEDRFNEAMRIKLALVAPYREALSTILGQLVKSEWLSVTGGRTGFIRQQGLLVMRRILEGASDGKRFHKRIQHAPAMLYLVHWLLLLQDLSLGDAGQSEKAVSLAGKLLDKARRASGWLSLFSTLDDLGEWAEGLVGQEPSEPRQLAEAVLRLVFQHRKVPVAQPTCNDPKCVECLAPHLPTMTAHIASGNPVHFILPAFPAKSPNGQKTLGCLPDMGEEIALRNLQALCDEIKAIYAPGAKITICSDGRIFADLVEVSDDDVSAYVAELSRYIDTNDLGDLSVVNLEDLMTGSGFDEARDQVMAHYGEPFESLTERIRLQPEMQQLFNGIHRFVSEDRAVLHPELSARQAKETSKKVAIEVIRRSNAWTRFIASAFPHALRLSIHPYPSHHDKVGIRLTKAIDEWLTPWHGVVVLAQDGYQLMKRRDAEAMGAKLIEVSGRPHHYTISQT